MPLPQLLYAQVIKTVRRRHLVRVSHRVVFGTLEAVNAVLAPLGCQINTAFIERLNLTLRQCVSSLSRQLFPLLIRNLTQPQATLIRVSRRLSYWYRSLRKTLRSVTNELLPLNMVKMRLSIAQFLR